MGLGRSVGFTGGIRQALGHGLDEADDFAGRLAELLGYFTGKQTTYPGVHAWSAEGSRPEVFVLAMGAGAEIAAGLGLPWSSRRPPHGRSGGRLPGLVPPLGMVRGAVRDDRDERGGRGDARGGGAPPASRCLVDGGVTDTRRVPAALPRRGDPRPPLTDRERRALDRARAGQVHGTPADVAPALADLVRQADADEVLVTMTTFDAEERLDSYRRLAGIFGS